MDVELWVDPEEWRSRVRQSQLTERPADLTGLHGPPRHNLSNPPATKFVRVEALTATWCVNGQPVEVGQVYTVAEHDVAVLELRGKARRV